MNVNKADLHMEICRDINALYQRKNHDYGDSFAEFYAEFGLISTCMRLTDKLKRLKSFAKGQQMQVKDESVMDTLVDLANYAIMTVVEMKMTDDAALPKVKPFNGKVASRCQDCQNKETPISHRPCSECMHNGNILFADMASYFQPMNPSKGDLSQ